MNLNNPEDIQQPTSDSQRTEQLRETVDKGGYSKEEWMQLMFSSLLQEINEFTAQADGMTLGEVSNQLQRCAGAEEIVLEFHNQSEQTNELAGEIGESGFETIANMMDEASEGDIQSQFSNTVLKASSAALRDPRVDFEDVQDHLLYLAYMTSKANE